MTVNLTDGIVVRIAVSLRAARRFRRAGPPMTVAAREPSIRVVMMPKDTNAHGTIFGGVILSYIDQAAAVEAKRHGASFIVTVAMREVVFHEPVLRRRPRQLLHAPRADRHARRSRSPSRSSRSAIPIGGAPVKVTQAEVTFVNLDANRRPTPIPR